MVPLSDWATAETSLRQSLCSTFEKLPVANVPESCFLSVSSCMTPNFNPRPCSACDSIKVLGLQHPQRLAQIMHETLAIDSWPPCDCMEEPRLHCCLLELNEHRRNSSEW
eukprot:TRINITY_DN70887_c0_g1_i1.p1 TRINITY_DN70887_c0_g1~~TRINITY_DN70887_c0_g1_i1.p1  ORF type:complete len:110 (-),score=11.79 TRINITY_DN70887_c0_g1_i1:2-331(-)